MTIQFINKTILHCTCVWCGHEWDPFEKPKRCSNCKRHSWNGEDLRVSNPSENVPPSSLVNGKPPQLRHEPILDALLGAQGVVAQLVADYGPCTHPKKRAAHGKENCVCHEKTVLEKINHQIETLKRFATDSRPVPYVRTGRGRPSAATK